MLGKRLLPGKFTRLDVLTISARSMSIGSGIFFASGRMITIFPGCKTNELPKDPFRDKRKLPSSTRTFRYCPGLYSIMIVVRRTDPRQNRHRWGGRKVAEGRVEHA